METQNQTKIESLKIKDNMAYFKVGDKTLKRKIRVYKKQEIFVYDRIVIPIAEAPLAPLSDAENVDSNKPKVDPKRIAAGLTTKLEGVDYLAHEENGKMVKVCACCNETKLIDDFSNLKKAKDGKMAKCKECEKNRKRKNK